MASVEVEASPPSRFETVNSTSVDPFDVSSALEGSGTNARAATVDIASRRQKKDASEVWEEINDLEVGTKAAVREKKAVNSRGNRMVDRSEVEVVYDEERREGVFFPIEKLGEL